jgi:hypothetical protein
VREGEGEVVRERDREGGEREREGRRATDNVEAHKMIDEQSMNGFICTQLHIKV